MNTEQATIKIMAELDTIENATKILTQAFPVVFATGKPIKNDRADGYIQFFKIAVPVHPHQETAQVTASPARFTYTEDKPE